MCTRTSTHRRGRERESSDLKNVVQQELIQELEAHWGTLMQSKRSAHPPLGAHDHSSFLSGNNSSMRLLGQEGSFSRVSISQAMGSMPFRRAVSSSD